MEPNLSVPIAYLTHFNSTSGFPRELLVNTLFISNPNPGPGEPYCCNNCSAIRVLAFLCFRFQMPRWPPNRSKMAVDSFVTSYSHNLYDKKESVSSCTRKVLSLKFRLVTSAAIQIICWPNFNGIDLTFLKWKSIT